MTKYVSILVYYVPIFPYFHVLSCLRNSAYPLSYGFTSFIKSTTSQMSSRSNYNTNNTKSVIKKASVIINYNTILRLAIELT